MIAPDLVTLRTRPHRPSQQTSGSRNSNRLLWQPRVAPTRGPLSLYVHVPFCSTPCFYCGCNRVITRSVPKGEAYVARLLREIELVGPLFENRRAVQVHFGGGTPNFLAPQQLAAIIAALRARFKFAGRTELELSIEIDPRWITAEDVVSLAAIGFNRVSLGVQDFDAGVQAAVNRIQSAAQTLDTIQACRRAGIQSINLDLIYGLPRQSVEGFRRTLRTVVEVRPARVAVYGYAHMPQIFKAQRRIRSAELPDARTRVALLGMAIDTFSAAGYRYIGMDHFALPDDELVRARSSGALHRNFMGYTTHAGCDLLGLGVSAISHLGDSYSQNPRDLPAWEQAIDAGRIPVWRGLVLDADDKVRSAVINQIMCGAEVDLDAIGRAHSIDFWGYFSAARQSLAALEGDGLIEISSSRLAVTERGRYLLRSIAACFDRYLPARSPAEAAGRFSAAV